MRKVVVLVCLLLVALTVVGCASDEQRFVGTWYPLDDPSVGFEFCENGTYAIVMDGVCYANRGRWFVDGDYLVVDGDRVKFSLNGSTLTVSLGDGSRTFKKG